MIDRDALLNDLRGRVAALEADLRQRCEQSGEPDGFGERLHAEWQHARARGRTAAPYESWLGERVTQSAVAWVLATVFVRYCEDNQLIDQPYLAGPGERLAVAQERQAEHFQRHPAHADRDWVERAVAALAVSPVAAGLFDRAHNPMWQITPSHAAAKDLLGFWRRRNEDAELVHDFTGHPDTRFLGDLYQDLSEDARKSYALLQTPEFVESFILDYTLEPAVAEFGLEGLRLVDPACGSGHFLLGAFHRLLEHWRRRAPNADGWDLVRRALASVHGVDRNPSAVAIARFRLLLAALAAGGLTRLDADVAFPLNVACGDALLHGHGAAGETDELFSLESPDGADGTNSTDDQPFTYATEDVGDFMAGGAHDVDMLRANSYHVVVGNPPYITPKDSRDNENYRRAYRDVCSGTYALSVPFAKRFFRLARGVEGADRRGAGYTGQITANSFMKREFGRKLIEDYFAQQVELTHVIDTSGAYIPGHGTPTVILIGRNDTPSHQRSVRAVLGVNGEPEPPESPAAGLVWRAIVEQVDDPGSESDWVTVTDLPRERLRSHPWSLTGGGASDLIRDLESGPGRLADRIHEIGFGAVTREDSAYLLGEGTLRRLGVQAQYRRPLVEGDVTRDWLISSPQVALWPYDENTLEAAQDPAVETALWPYRNILRGRVAYGKSQLERDLTWFEYSMFFHKRYARPLSIAFGEVATHNHFVLDRGGRVFKQTAPVIKLPKDATEDDHLALLGALNSSTACFWLKQMCHKKGSTVDAKGARQSTVPWEDFFQFNGTRLEQLPLPAELPLDRARELDRLAQELAGHEPSAVCAAGKPSREKLDAARAEHDRIRARMIALQEELDWEVYRRYGLLDDAEAAEMIADPDTVPSLNLGERAFEIALARRQQAGETQTQWFARHGSTPIVDIPGHWPADYRAVVERRLELVARRRDLALIERPECKRRWQSWTANPWRQKEREALAGWLLDACERRDLWYETDEFGEEQPRPLTLHRLADRLRTEEDVVAVAELYAAATRDSGAGATTGDVLEEVLPGLLDGEHVPYLAALRYKESGLRKRAQWEHVWDEQRREDADGTNRDIDVPPKYAAADFRAGSYWSNRGKLDVPKERFVSYPHATPDTDGSLLLGWAGWDNRERAHVLMMLVERRATDDGWAGERLVPLLAGLDEQLPWVRQWHDELNPTYGVRYPDAYAGYLETKRGELALTERDLRNWRPSGRRKK